MWLKVAAVEIRKEMNFATYYKTLEFSKMEATPGPIVNSIMQLVGERVNFYKNVGSAHNYGKNRLNFHICMYFKK